MRLATSMVHAQGPNKITKHVEREVICHSNFCHPHVVQFKEIFLTPSHLGIAMEYAPGGDMFQYVKKSNGLKVCMALSCLFSVGSMEDSPAAYVRRKCPFYSGVLRSMRDLDKRRCRWR